MRPNAKSQGRQNPGPTRLTLSFRQGQEVAAPVQSEYGRIHVSLSQGLEAVQEGDVEDLLLDREQTESAP